MPFSTRPKSCPIVVQTRDLKVATKLFALTSASPADISLKAREIGFRPYGARFDMKEEAWVVSAIDWEPAVQRASR